MQEIAKIPANGAKDMEADTNSNFGIDLIFPFDFIPFGNLF